jgi:hypothetical protein
MQVGAWYRVGMSVLLLLARCVNAQPVSRVHRILCVSHVRSLAGVGGVHYVVAAPARALVLRLGSRGTAIGWVRVEGPRGVEGAAGTGYRGASLSGRAGPVPAGPQPPARGSVAAPQAACTYRAAAPGWTKLNESNGDKNLSRNKTNMNNETVIRHA